MNNPKNDTRNFELLRLFDALRPRCYRVQVIAPDGSITHDEKFGTHGEAKRYGTAKRGASDMVMTFVNDIRNN